MSRYAHDNRPNVPKVERAEISGEHFNLRVILLALGIVIAVAAFGYGISQLLTPQTGWQQVDAASKTPAAQEIRLQYCFGTSNEDGATERRTVSNVYSQALEAANAALSDGLSPLWENPETPVTLDKTVYTALQTLENTNSRAVYYAPLYDWYNSLFAAQSDSEAAAFAPEKDADAAEFVAEVTEYVRDSGTIQVELLPENQAVLHVSQAYLAYCRENEIEKILDFGWLKNALLLDAVGEELRSAGLTQALLTSTDGYSLCLAETRFGVNLLENQPGTPRQVVQISVDGPCAIVAARSFPIGEQDAGRFYTWQDGSISSPWMDFSTGLLRAQNENLILVGERAGTVAAAAADCMATWDLPQTIWLYSRDEQVVTNSEKLDFQNLYTGYTRVQTR